jgi:hypothetical protein
VSAIAWRPRKLGKPKPISANSAATSPSVAGCAPAAKLAGRRYFSIERFSSKTHRCTNVEKGCERAAAFFTGAEGRFRIRRRQRAGRPENSHHRLLDLQKSLANIANGNNGGANQPVGNRADGAQPGVVVQTRGQQFKGFQRLKSMRRFF